VSNLAMAFMVLKMNRYSPMPLASLLIRYFLLLSLLVSPKIKSFCAASVAATSVHADGAVSTENEAVDDNTGLLIRSLPTDKFYINGTWVHSIAESPGFFDLVDPSTAQVAAKVALGSAQDVNAAVLAAKEAWPRWNYETSPKERQQLVQKLIDVYSSRFEEMAKLISTEMGSPITAARSSHVGGGRGNIMSTLKMMKSHFEFERPLPNIHPENGDEKHTTILYESVGVVGMITPWNWPLHQITLVSRWIMIFVCWLNRYLSENFFSERCQFRSKCYRK
jgi:hypothetical protein